MVPPFVNQRKGSRHSFECFYFMKIFIGIIHICLIIACLAMPWFLDWKLIGLGILIFWVQWIILGGCILTKWQYGDYNDTMWNHIFKFLHIPINEQRSRFITTWVLPIIIFITSVIIQNI